VRLRNLISHINRITLNGVFEIRALGRLLELRRLIKLHYKKLRHLLKSSIFWNITSYSPLKVNLLFEGICRPLANLCLLLASCLPLAWLILRPWAWKKYVSLKRLLTFNGLHDIISQKIELKIIRDKIKDY
jgi:hypothetical protein